MTLPEPRASRAWRIYLRGQYRIIRLLAPLVGPYWRGYGLGNIVELRVPGWQTGRPRPILLGLLQAGGHWFLGHPNGDVAWTRNLEAAGSSIFRECMPRSPHVRTLEPTYARDAGSSPTRTTARPGRRPRAARCVSSARHSVRTFCDTALPSIRVMRME